MKLVLMLRQNHEVLNPQSIEQAVAAFERMDVEAVNNVHRSGIPAGALKHAVAGGNSERAIPLGGPLKQGPCCLFSADSEAATVGESNAALSTKPGQ